MLRENVRLNNEVKTAKARNIRVWSLVLVLGVTNAITVGAGTVWFPKYRYIATADNKAICEVSPQDNSRVTPAALLDYAREAVVTAYSYDYVNYRTTVNATANRWFTKAGRTAFLQTLDTSGNLERVITGRLILKAMSTRVPQLEEEGLTNVAGQRYWIVHVPIAIEFYAGTEGRVQSRQDFLAVVTIVQEAATATNLKGIAVDSIALSPFNPGRS